MKLHPTQEKILDFISKNGGSIEGLTLRDIGEKVGVGRHPQIVSHHISQLEKKGYLRRDSQNKDRLTVLKTPVPDIAYINLYGLAECGPDGFFGEDTVLDRVPMPTRTFGISDPNDFFLVTARGKSMEPLIKEGDLVLARKQDDADSGSTAVVVHKNIPKIKKLLKNQLGENIAYNLVSLNSSFKDEVVEDDSDGLRIIGIVKGIIHKPQKPVE